MQTVDKTCKSRVWITPERVLAPVRAFFGGQIGLDPCTEPDNPTRARHFFTEEQNGLVQDWGIAGVFVNPPYGRDLAVWVQKIAAEAEKEVQIVALLPGNRTETAYFQKYVLSRDLRAMCFVRKRLAFLRPDGSPAGANPYGSVLYMYGGSRYWFWAQFSELGRVIEVRK
jgi:phage N-6-adenine-methyltransferase